jgi:hypothetical protein
VRKSFHVLGWLTLLFVATAATVALYPRALPLLLPDWKVDREEARAIALANLTRLGELPVDSYVVARLDNDPIADLRMAMLRDRGARSRVRGSRLAEGIEAWEITVYPPGKRSNEWIYRARVAPDGHLLELSLHRPEDAAGGAAGAEDAPARASRFLAEQGIDLRLYDAPEVKTRDLTARRDTTVRFRDRERLLGDAIRYGVQVQFAGDELAGFSQWYEDPAQAEVDALLQPYVLVDNFRFFSLFLLLPIVGVFFVRRYHEGVVGVGRGLRIFALGVAATALFLPMVARSASQQWSWGLLTREQTMWMWLFQMGVVFFMPQALVAALAWTVGESLCRERWSSKLAAFDALIRRDWRNRTVAISALRGLAIGAALAAILLAFCALAPDGWGRALASLQLGPWWESSAFPGVSLVLFLIIFTLYYELFGRLFLVPLLTAKLGLWPGALAATLLGGLIFWGPVAQLPMSASIASSLVWSAILVFTFLRSDFLTTIAASFTARALFAALPFVGADNQRLQIQGWIALFAVALPCLLSLRYLTSDREFVYRWEDVPPHVRRIAERERQRVELETARNIQSSILPQLPSQLAGVELAHTYLPATEVGGDFYDVLALEDGRLAVAIGDVAGHGVSSGLVMSMAKSALAVQVTFDPEVEAVFTTLNRMVFQSARKRLLATLCYALLDPRRREIQYASAGHLFPYRVTPDGRVESLESVAYPLGVRPTIDVVSRVARLDSGDVIFLCSDGLVEARREGSDEHFGFDRVERVLAEAAGNGAGVIRDRVLSALRTFTGDSPREDDLTLLVLRLP